MTMDEYFVNPLVLAILVPLLGGIGVAICGRIPNLREAVTLGTSLVLAAVIWSLLPAVLAGETIEFIPPEMVEGIGFSLSLEPLGMIFALVASTLWVINSLYSIGYMRGNSEKHQTRFYICFAIAIASVMGIALAGNLLTLFFFYEALTLSTYPLVTHKGDAKAKAGGRIYIGILLTTSVAFLLPAIIWTWTATGTMAFVPGGILAGAVSGGAVGILLLLYMIGIGKAALMPVHFWLPAAMVAPTPVSALLHAVAVVKAGVFTVIKVVVYVFGVDFLAGEASASWLLYAAGFTIILASLIALRQDNLKRRLAFSTVSQLSYVILAVALFVPGGIIAAALHIVAHAVGKITLFFAAGSIYTASHKTEISQLDGIGRRMPVTMTAFAIGALAMIGLPLTSGFISKWYLVMGTLDRDSMFALMVIMASTLLNAAYFLPIIYRAFFRPPVVVKGETDDHGEAPWPIVLALVATASLTILIFFVHAPLLALAEALVKGGL
ncbi:monovalent cation/H+ antiporter subunit D family protein [Paremcibacter congregatus]|uniref:monovalent cation/H+ antiporter subunit D family protein n=1 Tax=Paremcibacter congregatus TaxID=2043170 RepID=UPI0030EEE51E|tara:strand:+ start:14890 stop:16374 length:1485 start_codon:yes stop_codon:yes gene_type:complete